MSVTVELSELDAFLWDAFKRGGEWVAASEYRKLMAENSKLREELADAPKCETCEAMLDCDECLRADGSHRERRRLRADNAKLRELVRDMACEYECGYLTLPQWLADRMRELDIGEVER